MALVKLPSWQAKSKKPKAQTVGRNFVPVPKPPRQPALHFTTEMILAEMAKLKTTPAATPPSTQLQPAPADAAPASLSAEAPAPKPRRSKQGVDEGATSTRKKRSPIKREPVDLSRPGYLRLVDVLTVFPVSRAKWYAGIESGIYPKSHPLGLRAKGWLTSDIKALIERVQSSQ